MIDEEEEDVDKLLKRKISWKGVLKAILGFTLIGGSVFLIQISQQGEEINTTYLMLGIVLMCMASTVMVPIPRKKKDVRHTVSVLECEICDSKRVHDYANGDFVYKNTGISCTNCDGQYKILRVYSLKLKSKGKSKSK